MGSEIRPWVRQLTTLLDTRFVVPGTRIRFGLDTIAGFVPVIGDTLTLAAGAAIVMEAMRLGVRRRVLAKMGANLAIDWLVGLVPVADLVFDTMFKAHVRNLRLLEREVEGRGRMAETNWSNDRLKAGEAQVRGESA
ncbi:MAG TPA: DUF4112 domain-containing protein [Phycisphaerales bacterium]|nr:DUF4112 domain-containing protein [Phycisphaerales bacterium]